MGAVSSLNSLTAVIAPLIGAPLLGVGVAPAARPLGHRHAAVFRRRVAGAALLLAWTHFRNRRRQRHADGDDRGAVGHLTIRRPTPMHDKILILDFGSQVTQLIARRVREAHVYCEIHPNDVARRVRPRVRAEGHHPVGQPRQHLRRPGPARAAGGLGPRRAGARHLLRHVHDDGAAGRRRSSPARHREFGYAEVRARGHTRLLDGIDDFTTAEGHGMLKVWMSHGDKVTALPPGFKLMASTPSCPIAGIADEARGYYGVQFHPEVTHTVQGRAMLERFVLQIAGAQPDWVMRDHVAEAVAPIREQVGDEEVILGLSGGVDSSVAAALIHRAIGDQLTCVFVDHGLLRLNEGDMVMDMFVGRLHAKVIRVDASELVPRQAGRRRRPRGQAQDHRRRVRQVFKQRGGQADVGRRQGREVAGAGHDLPRRDRVAAARRRKKATTIKSHHNVGGLPAELGLKLLEPLRDLFKDEVRELGVALGLPPEMVYRHPFPGPGLGVRILGEVKREYADLLRARRCDLHRGTARLPRRGHAARAGTS